MDKRKYSSDIWKFRLHLIINSGVDLEKFGWKNQVSQKTSLSRRTIDLIIEKFPELFNTVFKKSVTKKIQHTECTKKKISSTLSRKFEHKELRYCEKCGREIAIANKSGFCKNCLSASESYRNKISETSKKNGKSGGYREGTGKWKHGRYKGYYCDSSWELAYVIYNLEHNIKFERNTKMFDYWFNSELHHYIPDFVESDVFIEIKGKQDTKWKAKLAQFPKDIKLKVLYKADMKIYLDYVKFKYGTDFIRLYDNSELNSKAKNVKWQWYTNTITKEWRVSKNKLGPPYILGRLKL